MTDRMLPSREALASIKPLATVVHTDCHYSATHYPASSMQVDLWRYWKLHPKCPVYNTCFSVHIISSVNLDALAAFFQLFIDRHAVLRTKFSYIDNQLVSIIQPQVVDFSVISVKGWSYAKIKTAATNAYRSPYDLENGPLLRVAVFCESETSNYLVVSVHHSVSDGWSLGILLTELKEAYPSLLKGMPIVLPKLGQQYYDFALWQKQFMKTSDAKKQSDYWTSSLPPEMPQLTLGVPDHNPITQKINIFSFKVPARLTARIRRFCASHHMTLNIFFFSAFQLLLHRYAQIDTIITGTPMSGRLRTTAGRRRKDFFFNVGYFVNMVLIDTSFSPEISFLDLTRQVQTQFQNAFRCQDLPFSVVKQLSSFPKSSHQIPQTSFVFQKTSGADIDLSFFLSSSHESNSIQLGELVVKNFYVPQMRGQFDLVLELTENNKIIACNFQFQSHLFSQNGIRSLAKSYKKLLSKCISCQDDPIGTWSLSMSTITSSIGPNIPIPQDTVIDLINYQCTSNGQATALVFNGIAIDYIELNNRANQIAHRLIECGVTADGRVGIIAGRSIEMMVGILGILKAGAAYIPIDPDWPESRQQSIISDNAISLLVTDTEPKVNCNAVLLDDPALVRMPTHNPSVIICPSTVAYVMATSGSTGRPKCIKISHHNIMNLLTGLKKIVYDSFDQPISISWVAPYTFDPSVQQWIALCLGHTVHIIDDQTRKNPDLLLRYWDANNIALSDGTPEHLRLIRAVDCRPKLPRLNTLLIGGESLDYVLVRDFYRKFPHSPVQIINVYGPTECTVDTAYFPVTRSFVRGKKPIPIGYPFPNTTIAIQDIYHHQCPPFCIGELVIGGDSVGCGYVYSPSNDSAFAYQNSARQYRTSDLGYVDANGLLYVVGRKDSQIKLHGFRIEIGEIESIINNCPQVKTCVVRKIKLDTMVECLVAYIIPVHNQGIDPAQVHATLARHLPQFMIPKFIIPISKIPLTPNGKLDTSCLPKPVMGIPTFVTPTTPIQCQLAKIWQDVLKIPSVGIHDNFFDLGGDSLLAVEFEMVAKRRGLSIKLVELYEYPTIDLLAKKVKSANLNSKSKSQSLIRLLTQFVPNLPTGIFIHPVFGSAECYKPLAEFFNGRINCYGLHSPFFFTNVDKIVSITELAAYYIQHISFLPSPVFLFGWSFGGIIAQEMARQLSDVHKQGIVLILADCPISTAGTFDIQDSPPRKVMAEWLKSDILLRGEGAFCPNLTPADQCKLDHCVDVAEIHYRLLGRHKICPTRAKKTIYIRPENRLNLDPKYMDGAWNGYFNNDVDYMTVPGDHYTMMHLKNIAPVLEVMNSLCGYNNNI